MNGGQTQGKRFQWILNLPPEEVMSRIRSYVDEDRVSLTGKQMGSKSFVGILEKNKFGIQSRAFYPAIRFLYGRVEKSGNGSQLNVHFGANPILKFFGAVIFGIFGSATLAALATYPSAWAKQALPVGLIGSGFGLSVYLLIKYIFEANKVNYYFIHLLIAGVFIYYFYPLTYMSFAEFNAEYPSSSYLWWGFFLYFLLSFLLFLPPRRIIEITEAFRDNEKYLVNFLEQIFRDVTISYRSY